MSGIAMGAVCAALMFYLGRACGLPRQATTLATAVVMLNPISIAIMPSFMTEMPSLALLLGCLLVLVRSLQDREGGLYFSGRGLALSTALGILAGSNRQINWVAFLGCLGLAYVFMHRDRKAIAGAAGVTVLGAALLSLWFARQPYTTSLDLGQGALQLLRAPGTALVYGFGLINVSCLFATPLLVLASSIVRRGDPKLLACLIVPVVICIWAPGFPYAGMWANYFTVVGVRVGGIADPMSFLSGFLLLAGFVVQAVGAIAVGFVIYALSQGLQETAKGPIIGQQAAVSVRLVMMAAFSQVIASLLWAAKGYVFDRYVVLLLPGVAISLAYAAFRYRPSAKHVRLAWGAMGLLWLVGTGFAWQYMNATRTRADLYRSVVSSGVPPENVDAGFEFNADVQVQLAGHMNNPMVRNPIGAYRPVPTPLSGSGTNLYPVIQPRYVLSTSPTLDVLNYRSERVDIRSYSTVLPPFRREFYLFRLRGTNVK
jgi:hypothetical protein